MSKLTVTGPPVCTDFARFSTFASHAGPPPCATRSVPTADAAIDVAPRAAVCRADAGACAPTVADESGTILIPTTAMTERPMRPAQREMTDTVRDMNGTSESKNVFIVGLEYSRRARAT